MTVVRLVGGSAPFVEALQARLDGAGIELQTALDEPWLPTGEDTAAVWCDSEDRWELLDKLVRVGPAVAILTELAVEHYGRALALGAGAVHHDNSTDIIVAVIIAAGRLEALVPQHVASVLAAHVTYPKHRDAAAELDALELAVVRDVVARMPWKEMARRHSFSERTLQRRLLQAKLRLGVTTRGDLAEWYRAHGPDG